MASLLHFILVVSTACCMFSATSVYAVPNDPCDSHEPTATNSLGCVLGPEGDDLKVGPCETNGLKRELARRLEDGKLAVRTALQNLQGALHLKGPELEKCVNMSKSDGWEGRVKDRLVRAMLSPPEHAARTLTVVAAGSSVTAGHDNLYAQSYIFAFERAVSCVLKAAGIGLVVRDAALGANQAFQYSLCNQVVVGAEADLVIWEVGPMMNVDPPLDWELAFRNFFNPKLFPNRPSLLYPSTGVSSHSVWGLTTPECHQPDCQVISGTLCTSPKCHFVPCPECPSRATVQKLHPAMEQLMQTYAALGVGNYMPFNCVYQLSDRWEFSGSYMLTAGKRVGQGKGWHFGPYGHKFFGELLAYIYLQLVQEAIEEVWQHSPFPQDKSELRAWADGYVLGLGNLTKVAPTPISDIDLPELFLESPQCATTFEPRQHQVYSDQNGQQIVALDVPSPDAQRHGSEGVRVIPGSDNLLGWAVLLDESSAPVMDMRDYCTRGSKCPVALQHRADNNTFFQWDSVLAVINRWVISIVEGKESRAEVHMGFTNKWGWRDRKYGLQGNRNSGTLRLKLHMKQHSKGLIVCDSPFCRPYKESCTGSRIPLGKGLAVELDGKDVSERIYRKGGNTQPGRDFQKFDASECLWLGVELDPGPHILGLRLAC